MSRLVLALLGLSGCSVGSGQGSLAGSIYVRNCTSGTDYGTSGAPAGYDMHPTFFVADLVQDQDRVQPMNRVTIRIEPRGLTLEEADVLLVEVASAAQVAQMVGQTIDVGPSTNIRAALILNETCPDAEVQMELDGSISFTSFGSAGAGGTVASDFRISYGDRLAASMSLDLVDRRALTLGNVASVSPDPTLSGHLDGAFDFVVRPGRGAQAYP